MNWMKRFVTGMLLLVGLATAGQAQNMVRSWTATSAVSTGPVWTITGTGITQHAFTWNKEGTVSAGSCKLEYAETLAFSSASDLIATQVVTSNGGPTSLTSGNYNYVRFKCGTAISGSGSVKLTYLGYVTDSTPVSVSLSPSATTGWDSFNATAADSATACTNSAQAVKASAGTVGGFYVNNPNTTDEWVHLYNVAAASVTVGTTAPKITLRIPGNSTFAAGANSAGAVMFGAAGVTFDTAIAVSCTSSAGGSGAPSNALEGMVFYK